MLLFPLAGAAFQAALGQRLGRRISGAVAALAVAASLTAALVAVSGLGVSPLRADFGQWFAFDGLSVSFSVLYDRVAGLMAVMVTFVALLIHLYAAGYMRDDRAYARFFCYLNLFVFFMLVIALADDLVFLFLGWEGVGFCSFALIGFWHDKLANVDAGRKAFLMTRVGDLGYVAALAVIIAAFGQASVSEIAARAATLSSGMATAVALCFVFAAFGKSAQLPLSAWLPDAMAGPTPVSALIHAATMVTAGVYLLMRLEPLLAVAPVAAATASLVGAATALYGAACAMGQRDVKRILAYSTISQVGYMFLAIGCGDVSGAFFHLEAHAFFKSLLFMCAGIMIQACHEEQDIFCMGEDLRRRMPGLFVLFACGAAALAALPLTSGYFSKGRTLADALGHAGLAFQIAFGLGVVAAFLTAVYVFRLLFVAFFAKRGQALHMDGNPAIARMERPLWPLAFLALTYGFVNLPEFTHVRPLLDAYLTGVAPPMPPAAQHAEPIVVLLDAALALAGMALAWTLYRPARRPVAPADGWLTSGLGLDALYRTWIAGPYCRLAAILWQDLDETVFNGGVSATASGVSGLSQALRRLGSGRVSASLAALFGAAAAVLLWLALSPA